MLVYVEGDLLLDTAEALVNPVNTVGVMGAGLAKRFKELFPSYYRNYQFLCANHLLKVGRVHVYTRERQPQFLVSFPTKEHWRDQSRLEWVASGLQDLVLAVRRNEIKSIAIPKLGCGLGGLDWGEVKPLVEQAYAQMEGVTCRVYM